MSAKVSFLVVSFVIVLLPWLFWQIRPVRRAAPLAVIQILVGVLLGPSAFGRLAPGLHAALFSPGVLAGLDGVANLGVLLYVFVTGLHLDAALLRKDARRFGPIALGSVLLPLGLGLAAAAWMLGAVPGAMGPLGSRIGFMLAVAICIAVTALPVLAAVLGELGTLHTRLGQTALALAALNDAALWIMLAGLLTFTGSKGTASGVMCLAASVLWFAALLGVVRPRLRHLRAAGEQTILMAGVALAILSAAISEALGTGYLIGAFAAGAVMPAASRQLLLGRLEVVTATVLLPFFFMSTGLKALIDPGSASFLAPFAVSVVATLLGKLAGTALPARRLGFGWAESLSLGVMMQTKGLMEVVVLAVLQGAGLIGTPVFSVMVAMAVLCTVLTAPAVRLCERLDVSAPVRRSVLPDAQ